MNKPVYYTDVGFDSSVEYDLVHVAFDVRLLKDRKRLNRLFDELLTRLNNGEADNVLQFGRTEDGGLSDR